MRWLCNTSNDEGICAIIGANVSSTRRLYIPSPLVYVQPPLDNISSTSSLAGRYYNRLHSHNIASPINHFKLFVLSVAWRIPLHFPPTRTRLDLHETNELSRIYGWINIILKPRENKKMRAPRQFTASGNMSKFGAKCAQIKGILVIFWRWIAKPSNGFMTRLNSVWPTTSNKESRNALHIIDWALFL